MQKVHAEPDTWENGFGRNRNILFGYQVERNCSDADRKVVVLRPEWGRKCRMWSWIICGE